MKRIITTFLAITGCAFGAHVKIAKDLNHVEQDSMVDVIVQFRGTPTPAHHAKVIRRGGSHRATLDVIKGGAYSVPASALAELANDDEVAYITPDRVVRGSLDNANPSLGGDVARSYGLDGSGIGVAILDSGVTKHQDLMNAKGDKSRIVYSQSFVGGGSDDHYGHGTHVAGIIGGNGNSSTGSNYTHTFLGLAPNVNIVNLRVLDDKGAGQDSSVISAIQQAIALKNTYNIRVLNLSLGRAVTESFTRDPLCQAVAMAPSSRPQTTHLLSRWGQ